MQSKGRRTGPASVWIACTLLAAAFGAWECGNHELPDHGAVGSVAQPASGLYDWLQFGGDPTHSGNNKLETKITPQNVGGLQQLFKINLPETIEGAPVVLTNVSTPSGVHDVAYMTSRNGTILAIDAYTGSTIWSKQPAGPNITMSSPAIEPSRNYVFSSGLDGYIHKYAVGDGTEVTTGGWPELATLKTSVEKDGTAITIATSGGTNYLYLGAGGYDGDGGEYQGHVTIVNLSNGAQKVFNAMCSDQAVHFTLGGSPDCSGRQSGIWAKAGVTFDPATNRLYAGTGNGTFNPASHFWGDSIVALNPDGSGINGGPVDSYTPSNYQSLQNSDKDLGSTNLLILANNGSKYPHLGMQSGKDAVLRLINLDNMSGQGGPGHVAGEVSQTALPTGGEVQNPCATWINPADNSTWVFIVSPSNGINALRLSVDGSGNPSLVAKWSAGGGGGGAAVANNVLYYASNNNMHALDPTTGAQLWHDTSIGGIHWQTPTIANGVVYIGDNGRKLTAYGTNGETPLARTGWVATASSSGGGDVPANALDGNTGTRWSTGNAMTSGMFFQVDMGANQTFDEIALDAAGNTNDYPRGYQIFVSTDGTNFGNAIASGTGLSALIAVKFPAQNARFIKVVQTGAASNWWSIAEFNVYTSGGTTPPPPPQPPSGLAASAASSSSINLSWSASPTSGVTYSLFRSTSASFTPSASNQVASGIGGLSQTDSGLSPSTTYYYFVEAVNGGGASTPSNEANATTSAGGGGGGIQINCGGPAAAPYLADQDFTGGSTINHANAIDTSGVTNPAPVAVYQTARLGGVTYTIPGFAAGSSHTVRLHFAETYWSAAGSRLFNVSINGTQVLSSYDVFQAAGAKNKAVVASATSSASSSGAFVIQLTSVKDNALVSGIEIQ
jgi:hypothetical protein